MKAGVGGQRHKINELLVMCAILDSFGAQCTRQSNGYCIGPRVMRALLGFIAENLKFVFALLENRLSLLLGQNLFRRSSISPMLMFGLRHLTP
jgi:hypothetical protein